MGSSPRLSRYNAMISVGMTAHVCMAFALSVAWSMSRLARKSAALAMSDTAERSASRGTKWSPARAMAGSSGFTDDGMTRNGLISSMKRLRSCALGSRPSNRRRHTSSSVRFSQSSTALYWR